jgi:site-specific recombinase XerD
MMVWEARQRAVRILEIDPETTSSEHRRHTAATRMIEKGFPHQMVAAILGWSPATMFLMSKKYAHICQNFMRDVVSKLE